MLVDSKKHGEKSTNNRISDRSVGRVNESVQGFELFSACRQQILKFLCIFNVSVSLVLLSDLVHNLCLCGWVWNFVDCLDQLSVELDGLGTQYEKL